MYDYSVRHFLGIFLVTIPVFVFLLAGIYRFIFELLKNFFEIDNLKNNIFHHHFHYKDRR